MIDKMPQTTTSITNENTPDQRLIESLIIESIKVYGIDVHYTPENLNKGRFFVW